MLAIKDLDFSMFSASSVRIGLTAGRARSGVVCKLQHAARCRSTPPRRPCVHRAVRYISEESRSANRTGSRPPFSFWKGGRPDLGRILRISFFVLSVFYGRTVFSLSFGFVVFTTLHFRDEDVLPCTSGLRGPLWCISSLHSGLVSVSRPREDRSSTSSGQRRFTYDNCNL